jgi:hypothetical protein
MPSYLIDGAWGIKDTFYLILVWWQFFNDQFMNGWVVIDDQDLPGRHNSFSIGDLQI